MKREIEVRERERERVKRGMERENMWRKREKHIVYKEYPGKIFLASHVFVRMKRETSGEKERERKLMGK